MDKKHLKIKISELKPFKNNPKKHNEELIEQSISELGFVDDIVVDENNRILAGHGRLKALKKLGHKEVDIIKITGWTEKQKEKYLILSNKSVEAGGWDQDLLKGFDEDMLASVGFSSDELDKIFKTKEEKEDNVPETPEEPKAKLGDIYQLGNHRIMCGDSTDEESVKKLMNGEKADMVFTDPPYGVSYDGGSSNEVKREKIIGDEYPLYIKWLKLKSVFAKDTCAFYIWYAGGFDGTQLVYKAIYDCGLKIRSQIIWNKIKAHYGALGSQYKQKHEPCLYCVDKSPNWFGKSNECSVWDIEQARKNEFHPTQKPVALAERAITNSSKREDMVLDLFLGSGSTLIACEKTNRKCYGMELDPKYIDVIIQRYEDYSGNKAKKING